MENMIIFLTPLADHFTCFKQKLLKKNSSENKI